ncbi:MAG: 6-hydroxymethylpterin diphosphokinase MptE-like protein [Candidatus Hodarchaeales archaeon]|jgi:uncharacterized Rossmann fold enzyme
MKRTDWNLEYKNIVNELGLDVSDDKKSSFYLDRLLNTHFPNHLRIVMTQLTSILAKPVIVVGAGPSVITNLEAITSTFKDRVSFIAVDGTCTLFQQLDFHPDIVITDLDGEWGAIQWAISCGAITLIHAHGDNHNLIRSFFNQNIKLLTSNLIWGTTQNDLQTNLLNYGGFTDGDRAIFLAMHYQSPIITLIGFDFGEEIGEYSKMNPRLVKDPRRKIKKFKIAKYLLNSYYHVHTGTRLNLTSQGENLQGFSNISLDNFEKVITEWYGMQNK